MSDLYALIETTTNAEQRRSLFASEPPTPEDIATGLAQVPILAAAKGVQWILASSLPPPPAPIPPTLDDLKAAKLSDIEQAFSTAMAAVKAGYPADEILSWDKQEQEARAWLADNAAATPMIDAMLLQRTTLTKTELVARIVAKADIAAGIVGTLVGKRQALEDQIADATLETIGSISWAG